MGINGLHKGLGFCTVKTNVSQYRNQALAVDASSWLHKSVYSCSERYVESMEQQRLDERCIDISAKYIGSRCQELLTMFGIRTVYLVMDGKRCPLKVDTNTDRESKRQENLREARAFQRQGQREKAQEKYKGCIKIKHDFTIAVMAKVAKQFSHGIVRKVKFVWSPYEADAQLAALVCAQKADVVITEDSDVLVYSAACHTSFPILFKVDRRSGDCDMISMDWLLGKSDNNPRASRQQPSFAFRKNIATLNKGKKQKKPSALEGLLQNFADRQHRKPGLGVRLFVQASVLSGCDYASNELPGVGLVNAFKLIRDNAYRQDQERFQRVLASFPNKVKNALNVEQYEEILSKSEAVFYYHLVKDETGTIGPLNPFPNLQPENEGDLSPTHHFPATERFGDALPFLGDLEQSETNQNLNDNPIESSSSSKPLSIFPPSNSNHHLFFGQSRTTNASSNNTTSCSAPVAPKVKRPRLPGQKNPYDKKESSRVREITNPYRSNTNHKKPASSTNNTVQINHGNNRFAEYAAAHKGTSKNQQAAAVAKENQGASSSDGLHKYLNTKNQDDVRFVKRKFGDLTNNHELPQQQQRTHAIRGASKHNHHRHQKSSFFSRGDHQQVGPTAKLVHSSIGQQVHDSATANPRENVFCDTNGSSSSNVQSDPKESPPPALFDYGVDADNVPAVEYDMDQNNDDDDDSCTSLPFQVDNDGSRSRQDENDVSEEVASPKGQQEEHDTSDSNQEPSDNVLRQSESESSSDLIASKSDSSSDDEVAAIPQKKKESSFIDLSTSSDEEASTNDENGVLPSAEGISSKYFNKQKSGARRVTLETIERDQLDGSISTPKTPARDRYGFSSGTGRDQGTAKAEPPNDLSPWQQDEIIESPDFVPIPKKATGSQFSQHVPAKKKGAKGKVGKPSIMSAFQRQQELSLSQDSNTGAFRYTNAPSIDWSNGKPNRKRGRKSTGLTQLQLFVKEKDDGF